MAFNLATEPLPVFTEYDYLRFMLEATKRIQEFLTDKQRPEFLPNTILADAVTHSFTTLGFAAADLLEHFPDASTKFPPIPFEAIENRCNGLLENYADVDLETLWTSAHNEIPHWHPAIQSALDS